MSDSPTPAPAAPVFPPVKRSEIFGWCCFDFANSAFTTVIITVVYSRYFVEVVAENAANAPAWWGRALSFSQLVVIAISPLIGAMADARASKKSFLMTTALVCSLATMALYFVGRGEVWLALSILVVANMAFSLSENLCAGFLPEISTPENVGRISGYGWSFGYLGGLLSLLLALAIHESGPGRDPWSFVMTGVFFLGASLPTLLLLRERAVPQVSRPGESALAAGWKANLALLKELPQHRTLMIFFVAMTCYTAGLVAVINFSALYASEVLKMTVSETVTLFVILQLSGVAGAYGFGVAQDKLGSKVTLIAALMLWVVVSVWVAWCRSKGEFLAIGVVAGIGLGSVQSAGRAVVSMLTPPARSGEFFGCWGFFGKLAAIIGPLVFGELASRAGYRPAILVNGVFFLIGLFILFGLNLTRVPASTERSAG